MARSLSLLFYSNKTDSLRYYPICFHLLTEVEKHQFGRLATNEDIYLREGGSESSQLSVNIFLFNLIEELRMRSQSFYIPTLMNLFDKKYLMSRTISQNIWTD